MSLTVLGISRVIWDNVVAGLVLGAVIAVTIAIVNERRMQRHRQPGVTYSDVTFRRDGAWQRAELFTAEGLVFQRRAAKWGMIGAAFLVVGLILWSLTWIL